MNASEALKSLLVRQGFPPESNSARQIAGYFGLLEKWNSHVNLVSSTDWRVVGPLFEEALWAAGRYPGEFTGHLDIGSGAGFPAVPLKILNPGIQLEMIESRARRAAFLETVVRELGLNGTRVWNRRLDQHLRQGEVFGWDCVSWKGIRLAGRELSLLDACCKEKTQFWIFHGKTLAIEEGVALPDSFFHLQSEAFPGKRSWRLSIYEKRGAGSRLMPAP